MSDTDTDRPTGEQVDAALHRAELRYATEDERTFAAEVRALRAELEQQQQRFTEVWRRGHLKTSVGARAEINRLRAALAARTPQPAEPPEVLRLRAEIVFLGELSDRAIERGSDIEYLCRQREERVDRLHSLGYGMTAESAPLPAVPDGEDVMMRRQWAAWLSQSSELADDLSESERHGLRIAASHLLDPAVAARARRIDGLDGEWLTGFSDRLCAQIEDYRSRAALDGEDARDLSEIRRLTETHPNAPRGELLAEVRRLVENDDHCADAHRTSTGEDVPARLDAAADALNRDPKWRAGHAAAGLRSAARKLRGAVRIDNDTADDLTAMRAVVAAALARPTRGRVVTAPDEFRILITGNRHWEDRDTIARAIAAEVSGGRDHDPHGPTRRMVVIHGGAPGADTIAGEIAAAWGMRVEVFPADWAAYGRAAGPRRNAAMVAAGATVCLAFPIGASPGTRNCMRAAAEAGIPVLDFDPALAAKGA